MFTSHVESAACLRAIFHLHCNANKVKELPSAERLKGYILSERFARVFKAYVRTHRTTPRCKETRACTSVCTCSFTDSRAIKLARAHPCAHTHTTQHVLCKAKMLLTVLNKTLNHLCQTEGSEKRERGEEAISLAGKMP